MRVKVTALIALAWGLSGCGNSGEVYPMPVSKVAGRLRGMVFPSELGLSSSGGSAVTVETASEQAVTWRISEGSRILGWVDATLDPVDVEHTRVDVAFRVDDGLTVDSQAKKSAAVIGRAAFVEAVDAELENRSFNQDHVKTELAAYAITHRDEVQALAAGTQTLRDEVRSDRGTAPDIAASHPEWAAAERDYETRRKMDAASAPSLKLPGSGDEYR